MKTHPPVHPGEVLREDFLMPLGLSEYRLAKDIGVPPRRIHEIVKGLSTAKGWAAPIKQTTGKPNLHQYQSRSHHEI